MKVCVYGCGAMGSLLAYRLATAGADVSVVARGAQLQAVAKHGLRLIEADGREAACVPLAAHASAATVGEQDVVFIATKAHALTDSAADVATLLGEASAVVTAGNGIPWWYFYGLREDFGAPELHSVDPGKAVWNALDPARAVGSVLYPAARVDAPGVVRHVFGDRITLGEPDGTGSERVAAVAALLTEAGFDAPVQADIRTELWIKLMANAAFNPVSVITGKTLGDMLADPATANLLEQIMQEVTGVAHELDIAIPVAPRHIMSASEQLGAHKTSMLQDYEAGRMLELQPVVGAVLELAALRGVAAPNLAMVYQLASSKVEG